METQFLSLLVDQFGKFQKISSWFDPENLLIDVPNDSGRVTHISHQAHWWAISTSSGRNELGKNLLFWTTFRFLVNFIRHAGPMVTMVTTWYQTHRQSISAFSGIPLSFQRSKWAAIGMGMVWWKVLIKMCHTRVIFANEIFSTKIMFHTYIQDILWKIGVFKASKIQFLFSLLCRQKSANVTTVVQTDSALHWRENKNWILLALKTPILKIF